MDNMKIWNAVKQPPATSLNQIRGGRLSGMTDINPQWRYQIMTEQFGPCGVGWKWEIVKQWTEPGPEGQVFAFAAVNLYVRTEPLFRVVIKGQEDKPQCNCVFHHPWSDPIPGVGGSMLVAKESGGLHASDEAYKMAITDALSCALKMLGVAADIYAGKWDGTKYKDTPPQADPLPPKAKPAARKPAPAKEPTNRKEAYLAACLKHGCLLDTKPENYYICDKLLDTDYAVAEAEKQEVDPGIFALVTFRADTLPGENDIIWTIIKAALDGKAADGSLAQLVADAQEVGAA